MDEKITLRCIRTVGPEFNCFEVEGFVKLKFGKAPQGNDFLFFGII